MKLLRVGVSSAILLSAASLCAEDSPSDLIVHEWGTFLALQGSDGVTLDGMYHEEHALPAFVHARSRDQLRLPTVRLKGETPVIYFYTDRPQKVEVEVTFPAGIWTQWYPQAGMVAPGLAASGTPPRLRGGRILWCATIVPAGPGGAPALPETAKGSLWNFAREVDAAYVTTLDRTVDPKRSEHERFLFYRGLGAADLPVEMSLEGRGRLSAGEVPAGGLRHVFVLRVENGKGSYRYFPALPARSSLADVLPERSEEPLEAFTARISSDLEARLVESGLYPKEARAMVNTWRASYFGNEGVRVLFVLPQEWTDRFIPIDVRPRPKEIVRVMVGRLEVLTPERERAAEAAVRDLAASDPATRERAFARLRGEGRYVEPVVRRVHAATRDEDVRERCRKLLLTDFVTELRSAVNSPLDGARVVEDPVFVRAQLASLLREIGLPDEARGEAEAVLKALGAMKLPPGSSEGARHHLRAYARAMEGLGDDRAAAERYGELIRFASQIRTRRECTGCHDGVSGPRSMAWFPDWWAGERFARYEARGSGLDRAIGEWENALVKSPESAEMQMRIAYLRQARGDKAGADVVWSWLRAVGAEAEKAGAVARARSSP